MVNCCISLKKRIPWMDSFVIGWCWSEITCSGEGIEWTNHKCRNLWRSTCHSVGYTKGFSLVTQIPRMGAPETNRHDELHAATTNWMLPLWLCAIGWKPMLLLVAVDGVVVAVPGKPFNSLIHSHTLDRMESVRCKFICHWRGFVDFHPPSVAPPCRALLFHGTRTTGK